MGCELMFPCDRDLDVEMLRTRIPCQADVVELALALHSDPPRVGSQ